MADIIMRKTAYAYGKNEVLSIDNLSIKKGITTVFLGSNGSGKTTILKLISGIYYPSKGNISPETETLKNKSVLVHQNPYLFSGSVKYNMEFGLIIRKTSKKLRKSIIHKILSETKLLDLLHRNTTGLSGGEKHRLAIARALSLDPDTLILDEPFANIDIESRKLIEKLICQRSESGKTTILSTHNLSSAYRLADKIVYLENGKMKDPEYNFFKGVISGRDEHFCSFLAGTKNREVTILAPASDNNYKAAVIPYRDIFLSKDKIKSSAQNQLNGIITGLIKSGSQYFVIIDCGVEIKAVITDQSVKEFQLKERKNIYVNFKATAVRLY